MITPRMVITPPIICREVGKMDRYIMEPIITNNPLVAWMIIVLEASIYFSAEYWASPVINGPRNDPTAMFTTAVPGIARLSPRTRTAIIPKVNRKTTLFSVSIAGCKFLILLFANMILIDMNMEETRIQPDPSPKNCANEVLRV